MGRNLMTTKIITIAQGKGGAGKTTLTAQLAVGLSCARASVATIDMDPQSSLTLWYSQRQKTLEDANEIEHVQVSGWRMGQDIDRLKREGYDYILIDADAHQQSEFAAAIRMADLVLVPMQPSPMDLWASGMVLQAARAEHTPALVVLNRVNMRASLFAQMMEMIDRMNIECAQTTIGNRVGFASSMLRGLGVCETESASTSASVQEIFNLVREIKKHNAIKDTRKIAV